MRNILLLVDLGPGAENLAKKAFKIARQCNANLHLCNNLKTRVKEKQLVYVDEDVLTLDTNGFTQLEELAQHLTIGQEEDEFTPIVNCIEINSFNPSVIREMVVRYSIWMIIMDDRLLQLKNNDIENDTLRIISNLNCPVLLLPALVELDSLNKIGYITDLRYCDLGVVKFLKAFNAQIFVTHVSAPGLPDMEERYAQELLSEVISTQTNYWKIFLRNVKSKNIHGAITTVFESIEVKMLAFVNNKHQTFERLFDKFPDKTELYQNLPTLIFPYLNWYSQPSFYK